MGQVVEGQRIPGKPPCERELRVVQEARAWRLIPLGANLPQRPEDPKRSPPLTLDIASFETMKGHWTEEGFVWHFGTCVQSLGL